jgi:hypothetical protein
LGLHVEPPDLLNIIPQDCLRIVWAADNYGRRAINELLDAFGMYSSEDGWYAVAR